MRYRARRVDYPEADGLDALQETYALQIFRRCPNIEVVSFNGVPDEWEYDCLQPLRVWKRTTGRNGECGVCPTGRSSLPWKLTPRDRLVRVTW